MYKAVIFDLDGTLLDTLEDIAISCNYVLEQFKKSPLPIEDYKLIVGQGAAQLFKDLLPNLSEDEQVEALEIFEKHYAKQFDKHTKIYTDISKVLTFLQVRGIRIAVLSNKPNSFTKKCVIKYLQDWNFEAVYGIREGIPKKPNKVGVIEILKELHLDASEAIFIGDTKVDMQTAKNANMTSIGVLWGFRDRDELEKNGADYIVETPVDLVKLLGDL